MALSAFGSALPLLSFSSTGEANPIDISEDDDHDEMLGREHKRKTFDQIPKFGVWQAVVLLAVGFLGGIFSAVAGSGVDICSFSILSLLFRWGLKLFLKKILFI